MRFFWLSTVKDLRRYRRDATALALWFVLPLIMTATIGLVFGRGDANLQGLLLIADEDGGLAGTFLRACANPSAAVRWARCWRSSECNSPRDANASLTAMARPY